MKLKFWIPLLLVCAILMGVPTFAASPRLADEAGLLSGQEESRVAAMLDEISTRQGTDLVIVTVASTGGKTPMEYADDYFDAGGYRPDGILLLISMEENDYWISTAGEGITAFTDAGLAYISERFMPQLSDGDYAGAFERFATLCDEFLTQAKTGDPYDSHNLPKDPFRLGLNLAIAIGVGLLAAWFATGKMKSKLKSVGMQAKADDYVKPGSLQMTASRDLLLYTQLSKQEKAQSSSGSSTHTSSSGTTHGGGGGKF